MRAHPHLKTDVRVFGHNGGVRDYFTYGYGHSVREVAGSSLGRGTRVGGVFHPARQLARFSPPNMPFILNLFPWGSYKLQTKCVSLI